MGLWTFTGVSVTPVGSAKRQTGQNVEPTKNPVTITFSPTNEIPEKAGSSASGGYLRVTAPPNFQFVEEPDTNHECSSALLFMETGGATTFGTSDIRCLVDNSVKLELYIEGDKPVMSGKEYT